MCIALVYVISVIFYLLLFSFMNTYISSDFKSFIVVYQNFHSLLTYLLYISIGDRPIWHEHINMHPPISYNLNSLAPGRFEWNFTSVIFKLILRYLTDDNCNDLTEDKSTLVQVLNKCWLISMMPYGITRPQWVKKNHSYLIQLPQLNLSVIFLDNFMVDFMLILYNLS